MRPRCAGDTGPRAASANACPSDDLPWPVVANAVAAADDVTADRARPVAVAGVAGDIEREAEQR